MNSLNIVSSGDGVLISVRVIPASSRTMIAGTIDGMLKVKLSTVAEKGKANKALIDFLAKRLSVKKNMVKIVSGQTSRIKKLEIRSVKADDILAVLSCE